MKIAMIGTSLFHQGAEYVLATLARGMAERGHEVTVILSKCHEVWQREHPDWKPFELGKHVEIIILDKRRARQSLFSLMKIFKKGRYDVVLCHSEPYAIILAILAFVMPTRPLFVNVVHGGFCGIDSNGNKIKPHFSLMGLIQKWLYARLDAQFAVSDGTSNAINRMTGYPRDKIFTVYNPVIDDVFFAKLNSKPDHPWLDQSDIPVVIAAGAFCAVKNHRMLLHAWAAVTRRIKARLIIFGEGGLRTEYEKLIEKLGIGDSVSLPGFTNNLPGALKNAACFVVSSFAESFSIALVEALACGTPVASTNCPYGPAEILQNGKYGILVENNDSAGLADGIVQVLEGKGIAPTHESFECFTGETIVNRYEQAIENILPK